MTIEAIQAICNTLPGVTEDIKWEDHLCFNVGGKMFLVTSPDSLPVTASFKVADADFEELSSRTGFKPAPYMAKYKWVYLDDIKRLNKKEWTQFIRDAHRLVAAKLPARTRKQLGL